jgi:hypothetical protein
MKEQIQWTAPSPLWASVAGSEDKSVRGAVRQPAVLRFATDTFMEDFLRVLESNPSALTEYLAEPETWRGPSPAPPPIEAAPRFLQKFNRLRLAANRTLDHTSALARQRSLVARAAAGPAAGEAPLKLYQPAHLRYYLVAACLVCRVPGLPDHAPNPGREESIGFVVRRLFQKEGSQLTEEYAFVTTPRGTGWQRVTDAASTLAEGEERLPLFPSSFADEPDGRRRRLYAGMVPVGRREAYMGAGELAANGNGSTPGATKKTARKLHFRAQIAEPWKSLFERADAVRRLKDDSSPKPSAADIATAYKDSREQMQTMSWYIMLDLSKYLSQYLPNLWAVILDEHKDETAFGDDQTNEKNLYKALRDTAALPALKTALANTRYTENDVAASLLVALRKLANEGWGDKLEQVAESYDRNAPHALWPTFLFPLADPEQAPPLPLATVDPAPTPADESGEADAVEQSATPQAVLDMQAAVDNLVALVVRALPAEDGERAPAPPLASQPVLDARDARFVIRCVYERPLCGPLDPPVLSGPTAPFQMAGFFDPDAPARPIRIALPIDTTPAGLRKFDKNTVFMISDALCGQIQRMRGITFGDLVLSVLPWPFHKDLSSKVGKMGPCKKKGGAVELGMMCTLSIPIITICALILLMVIVLLFDFIFKWIPLFIFCFPLPKFKAKS